MSKKGRLSYIFSILILFAILNQLHAQITFTKHIVDKNERGASSVCTADFNSDGLIDIVSSAYGSYSISYYQNNGTFPISFTKQKVALSFVGSIFVDAADLNGDGLTDILGAAWEGNTIACWINDGADPINWAKIIVDDGFNGAHEVRTADIDGDGHIDILGAAAEKHQIAWWKNDGNDPVNWTKHIIDAQFTGARSVICDDFNNDGYNDVAGAALNGNEISIWINNGDTPVTWTKQSVDNYFKQAHWVHSTDFDNDGDIDIFGAAYSNKIAWYRNDGGDPVTWTKQIIDSNFGGALSVATGDLDGDGDLDAFGAATTADKIKWWRNDGGDPINWTANTIQSNFDEAWGLCGVDMDGDNDLDILSTAASDNEIAWWENSLMTDVNEEPEIPHTFALEQNYPNPFNPATTINYRLAEESKVLLKVYNLLGEEVAELVNGTKGTGFHTVDFDAGALTSGVYLYTLRTNNQSITRKMLLMK